MIVGAGFGQIPAIEKALEMGLEVITVDRDPNAVGMKLATHAYPIDIIDEKGVLDVAIKHNINGIMTMQTDLPIPTIGFVNDALKLTGVSRHCAVSCSNKVNTRIALQKKGIAQPSFRIVKNKNEALNAAKELGFPTIIKSVDSSGSRGVSKVIDESQVAEAFLEALKYTRVEDVLVEEFIDGIEIGAQSFSENGECKKVLIHNDTLSEGEFMVPTGHSFPTFLNNSQREYAEKTVRESVTALGIDNGPANIDLIFDKKDGKAKIIEIGARIGATCLPELVFYYSGIDWVKATILNALGEETSLFQQQETPVAAEILEAQKDGILKGIVIPQEVKDNPNLIELEVSVTIGDEISILRKGTDRIGKIVVKGENYQEAEELARRLKNNIQFIVED